MDWGSGAWGNGKGSRYPTTSWSGQDASWQTGYPGGKGGKSYDSYGYGGGAGAGAGAGYNGWATSRFGGDFMPRKLCNHFVAYGWCQKDRACTFAHGRRELHPDVRSQFQQFHPGAKGKGKHNQEPPWLEYEKLPKHKKEDGTQLREQADKVSGTYREDLYTTKLDTKNMPREKVEAAERIAKEIAESHRAGGGRGGANGRQFKTSADAPKVEEKAEPVVADSPTPEDKVTDKDDEVPHVAEKEVAEKDPPAEEATTAS